MLCAWSLVTGKPILVWAAHHDAITALDWIVRIFSSDFFYVGTCAGHLTGRSDLNLFFY